MDGTLLCHACKYYVLGQWFAEPAPQNVTLTVQSVSLLAELLYAPACVLKVKMHSCAEGAFMYNVYNIAFIAN